MVLLDIEKAFDSVWHDGLIYKTTQNNYPIFLVKLMQSFLTNRKSFVSLNGINSDPYNVPAEVPQGSLLSPHLFNIFINDIPKPHQCRIAKYADDNAIYASIPYKTHIRILNDKIEYGLQTLKSFFTNWKIKLNDSKTEAILFSHSRIIQRDKSKEKINFNNCELDWNPAVKYLGVWLDQKLLYRVNIEKFIKKSKKNIAILYPLLKKRKSLSFHSKLTLYRSYIRPALTYACPVWSNSAICHINKIQVTQNKCLRIIILNINLYKKYGTIFQSIML